MNEGFLVSTRVIETRLKQCLTAVQRLRNKGCDVLDVNMGNSKPVITIARPRPALLPGETQLIENTAQGRQETQVVRFADCLVKWRKPL